MHTQVDIMGAGPPEGMTLDDRSGVAFLPAKFTPGLHSCVIIVEAFGAVCVCVCVC